MFSRKSIPQSDLILNIIYTYAAQAHPNMLFHLSSLTKFSAGWLIDRLTSQCLQTSVTQSCMAKATGLISSLFNVVLPQGMSFHQSQQLHRLHHGSSKFYLCSPLCSICFLACDDLWYAHYGLSVELGWVQCWQGCFLRYLLGILLKVFEIAGNEE